MSETEHEKAFEEALEKWRTANEDGELSTVRLAMWFFFEGARYGIEFYKITVGDLKQ